MPSKNPMIKEKSISAVISYRFLQTFFITYYPSEYAFLRDEVKKKVPDETNDDFINFYLDDNYTTDPETIKIIEDVKNSNDYIFEQTIKSIEDGLLLNKKNSESAREESREVFDNHHQMQFIKELSTVDFITALMGLPTQQAKNWELFLNFAKYTIGWRDDLTTEWYWLVAMVCLPTNLAITSYNFLLFFLQCLPNFTIALYDDLTLYYLNHQNRISENYDSLLKRMYAPFKPYFEMLNDYFQTAVASLSDQEPAQVNEVVVDDTIEEDSIEIEFPDVDVIIEYEYQPKNSPR